MGTVLSENVGGGMSSSFSLTPLLGSNLNFLRLSTAYC